MAHAPSPFLDPGTHASANNIGILQLRRDHLIPAVLSPNADSDYAEGKVENTRFGSFPHSTLVDQPWGTQILASVVDTGSRGKAKKRKRDAKDNGAETTIPEVGEVVKKDLVKASTASSGFAHLIPPTPETWTLSLPHRTQVVYTPDYSYILQRLRVRPGDHIIEAGAGSGSFTHAAVRAVFNGYPASDDITNGTNDEEANAVGVSKKRKRKSRRGGVYSFEYHEPRAQQLQVEIKDHRLNDLVTVTHRDVYNDGFCLDDPSSPDADAIFLDLPAPWQALKHLTRSPPSSAVLKAVAEDPSTPSGEPAPATPQVQPPTTPKPFRSPLNTNNAIRICTFSPCIEQVTKTVSAMRSLGWLEIDMVEIQAKRLEVRRDRVGLQEEGVRGGNSSPATVQEAVQRLRDVEGRAAVFHGLQKEKQQEVMRKAEAKKKGHNVKPAEDGEGKKKAKMEGVPPSKQDRLERTKKELESRTLFKEGRLVHRTEPELKTHTSYLVFAVLPREWSWDDEEKARKNWA
ncbi:tRNA methyltransferase complex GCD14 subunit [Cucurbitaria berberidis CBS 394.84]|uniref:tRNA (adenine(58)-N(1))-methyltransferase catalytic subunit TRM61 n=1 Tax=Cucurbitaria berberidis CBS 394.84 TaxID=1168544 RepID=A0A9P4LA88_9PLEO|nr:tRNA methyltransferase complex GCD14 subunit [Cucurbitaria berberidis CBS 394.84]KAF1847820.1 tRNA methyltransferase complex GCD14 subunit [Cucurbitaria berberidis CBS 394.84]